METLRNNLHAALEVHEKGYLPVAMLPGRKIPAEKWTRWLGEVMTEESIYERWGETDNDIALLCMDLVVVDVDDAKQLEYAVEKCGLTPCICRTPRGGFHLHYRKPGGVSLTKKTKIEGRQIDILTGTALAIVPPSQNARGVPYEWLGDGLIPKCDLPVVQIAWAQDRLIGSVRRLARITGSTSMMQRARRYVACIEGAISGQGGHNRTMRVACVLMHKFGLAMSQAWPIFLEWNEQCEPRWSEKELLHKLQDAERLCERRCE